jgi:hypothetical protein
MLKEWESVTSAFASFFHIARGHNCYVNTFSVLTLSPTSGVTGTDGSYTFTAKSDAARVLHRSHIAHQK